MCGIIGYIGGGDTSAVLLSGLRRMEYRGYDSSGVAVADGEKVAVVKRQGKIAALIDAVGEADLRGGRGIGHTRWATHGAPSETNAHPHTHGRISVVHNGIIENYAQLKEQLKKTGVTFKSETDTEAVAALIAAEYDRSNDFEQAVSTALQRVEGTFGLLVLASDVPDRLIAARRGSPLLLGIGRDELFLASDATAIIGATSRVVYLDDDEIAVCWADRYKVIDFNHEEREHQEQEIELELAAIEKAGYDHFLLKEIMEQPKTITDILRGRLDREEGVSHLGGLNLKTTHFIAMDRFLTVGCGTAYYAGMLGKYLLERMTDLPVDVEFGSEFRYRQPVLKGNIVSLIISQSGETADTLASLREIKRRNIPSLGLVNVVGSSVAREVSGGVYLHAGPEISVASTKAFTAQVIAQLLVGLRIARSRNLSTVEGREVVEALEALPAQVQSILDRKDEIKAMAKALAHCDDAMYLGRDALYPVALEGSHKLKECSYIHAEAYPAGEMKHGANALIDENLLVVFLAPKNALYDKSRSNLEEVRARGGNIMIIGTEGDKSLKDFSPHVFAIPDSSPWTQPLLVNIPLQLFAYYVAVERGTDVDQPRNLAKSVTVE